MDYRIGGTEVSEKGKIVIQKLIKQENILQNQDFQKEVNELMEAFNLSDKQLINIYLICQKK